jgi:hypothetical protein
MSLNHKSTITFIRDNHKIVFKQKQLNDIMFMNAYFDEYNKFIIDKNCQHKEIISKIGTRVNHIVYDKNEKGEFTSIKSFYRR